MFSMHSERRTYRIVHDAFLEQLQEVIVLDLTIHVRHSHGVGRVRLILSVVSALGVIFCIIFSQRTFLSELKQ
jgi:hypothetical protein